MICLDPSDVRYKLYLDNANRPRVAHIVSRCRIVSHCRTFDIVSALIRVATSTSKSTNRRLLLTPFSFPTNPFSIQPFRSLSFWQGVCQRVFTRITPAFLQFSRQSG